MKPKTEKHRLFQRHLEYAFLAGRDRDRHPTEEDWIDARRYSRKVVWIMKARDVNQAMKDLDSQPDASPPEAGGAIGARARAARSGGSTT